MSNFADDSVFFRISLVVVFLFLLFSLFSTGQRPRVMLATGFYGGIKACLWWYECVSMVV